MSFIDDIMGFDPQSLDAFQELVFDHGKITQEGTYQQLAEEEGHFKDLLDASLSMAES